MGKHLQKYAIIRKNMKYMGFSLVEVKGSPSNYLPLQVNIPQHTYEQFVRINEKE